jgi:hypothetical protein
MSFGREKSPLYFNLPARKAIAHGYPVEGPGNQPSRLTAGKQDNSGGKNNTNKKSH